MTPSDNQPEKPDVDPRQSAWATAVPKITVSSVPPGATNINVEGRQVSGALQGFGQLWQKTYQVRLSGLEITPAEVMKIWKENFPKFHPPESRFYPPMTGVKPGEVLFIDGRVPAFPGSPSLLPVSSGVMVLYSDDESFSIMTPEGFPESGWNTFSAFDEDGTTVVQVQSLARAADPLYEVYFRYLGSSQWQENVWVHVLTSLAAHLGVNEQVSVTKTCLDSKVQWRAAMNIWKNAGIRTVFYKISAPLRWLRRVFAS